MPRHLSVLKQSAEQGHNIVRAQLFAAAGISFEKQADLLQKAVKKLEKKLDATKTELVTHNGEYEKVEIEDNAAQLRASETLIDLLGAKPSKQTNDGDGEVTINIVFPVACQVQAPQDVVVETKQIESVESEVKEINTLGPMTS
jgi:hypothetical protein